MSNILICGTRGTGKSTEALAVAEEWGGTIVIRDSRGSYGKIGVQCHSIEELQEHLESGDYIIDGVPQPLVVHIDTMDQEKSFEELCGFLFPPNFEGFEGKLVLLIDESANLQGPNYINPALDRLVGQHPLDDILVIQTTHEIKEWNSKCKSCIDEMHLFYQVGETNYTRIEELCGKDVEDTVRSFAPESKTDPKIHYFVRYSFREFFEGGKRYEICTDPSLWYRELGQQNRLPGNREKEELADGHKEYQQA